MPDPFAPLSVLASAPGVLAFRFPLVELHTRAAAARELVEQTLGALALHDRVRDLVGVPLVLVAFGADAALQGDARLLLHDVRGLVGGGVQGGARVGEGDVVAGCVGLCAERLARLFRVAAGGAWTWLTSWRPNDFWIASPCGSAPPPPATPFAAVACTASASPWPPLYWSGRGGFIAASRSLAGIACSARRN